MGSSAGRKWKNNSKWHTYSLNDIVSFIIYSQFTNVVQAAFYNQTDCGLQTRGLHIWSDQPATAHIRSKNPLVQYTIYRYFNSLDESGNYL